MDFYNKLILCRNFLVTIFSTNILGIYDENKEKIYFPSWLYFFYLFPFFRFALKRYDIIYNCDNIIYYSKYDNTRDIYPIISSVNLFDDHGNKMAITNIIKKYHFSVPLKIININEKLIGKYILVKYFSGGRQEKKIFLENIGIKSFGIMLK